MKISCVVNLDTRPVNNQFEGMWKGVRSRDFLKAGLENKRKFFSGFDLELIAHIDEHSPLTPEEFSTVHDLCDCVILRKHTRYYRGADPFSAFNDVGYLQALSMCRGEIVVHADQDVVAFTSSEAPINEMIANLEEWKFVCYPSSCSPFPCDAPSYLGKFWASTRWFMCKRETLDFTVLERAIREPQWFYETYDRPPHECPWTEQFLGILGGYKVLYPKPDIDRWCVFTWNRYIGGMIEKLNSLPYGEVASAIHKCGGSGIFWDGADATLMGI